MHVSETESDLNLRRSDHMSVTRSVLQSLDFSWVNYLRSLLRTSALNIRFRTKGVGGAQRSDLYFALHISIHTPKRMPLVPYGLFDLIPVFLGLKVSQGV